MENKIINQKEYLKKYISLGDNDEKKKKKKKKKKMGTKTVKIIDDDIDLKNMRSIEEGEFDIRLEGEDAPQIAGIVDERGPVDFTDKRRWKIITENDEGDLTIINRAVDKERPEHSKNKRMDLSPHGRSKDDSSDLSPPRSKHSKNKRIHSNPHRRSEDDSSDLSPPRPKRSKDKHVDSKPRGRSTNDDSDLSPPRQSKTYDSDLSPPRQSKNNDSDLSPPRKPKNYDSDLSQPRNTKHRISARSTSGRSYRGSGNRDSDSDLSPPRKRKPNLDTDFYESRKNKKSRDSDLSTSRRNEHRSRRDNSPHSSSRRDDRGHDYHDKKGSSRSGRQDVSRSSRDKREMEYEDRDRKSRSYSDIRKKRNKTRWDEETDDTERGYARNSKDHDGRATKTLDGKTAGFQAAKELREETEAYKRQEAEHFSKLSKEITGEGQATIMRDKTGRKRNLEAEAAEKREQEVKQREMKEKYAKWGKGLKQVEDQEEKLKDDLYEMHKPLARYADDADLDEQLRQQERDGDPMLQYLKQKQIKEGKRKPDPPRYQGSYAPNRFGIKPGHRWDGVDRSNGYEKKWFEAQNAKVALQEDAYKWSTADM